MSKARNDPNVDQPARDYDRLYMEESDLAFTGAILCSQMTTLCNQKLVFENKRSLARSIHKIKRTMYMRNRRRGGVVSMYHLNRRDYYLAVI
ncbi:hypothetical protein Scep_019662 [Stephania cephalantha]|uniref:Uncharacterized protein n=1 Tax=Stephania cephalantha TaxID=152367 RepID=A0AAP0IBL6_9MAGN